METGTKWIMDTVISLKFVEMVRVKETDIYMLISGKSDGTTPTREDVATTFTRLMIINDLPNTPFPNSFTGVKEVRFGGRCFENQEEEEDDDRYRDLYHDYDDYLYQDTYDPDQVPTLLKDCLLAIAPTSISPYSLQVKFQIGPNHNFDELESLLRQLNPPIPFTYEFYFKKMSHTHHDALQLAYKYGGIVHYEYPATYYNPDTVVQNIAGHLGFLFFGHMAGRVYLCDVPRLVLTPKEHHAAGDNVNETAKRRIFNNIHFGRDPSISTSLKLARWRVFDDRVKLVDSGSRPSTKTLISVRKRGRYTPQPRSLKLADYGAGLESRNSR